MTRSHFSIKRLLSGTALALGVFATAALSAPIAGAQAPSRSPNIPSLCPQSGCTAPPIGLLTVQALGTEATVSFVTIEPATATVDYRPVTGLTAGGQAPAQGLATTHERKLTGLKSNTAYDVTVTARTQAGKQHTAQTRFTTSKQRVRVTLREINITNDGDGFLSGDGEPSWEVLLTWAGGQTGGCYPNNGAFCETGSHSEGRIFPKNYRGQSLSWIFAEENFDRMPAAFKIGAAGNEHDDVPILSHAVDCFTGSVECGAYGDASSPAATTEWRVPAGQEWASTPIFLKAGNSGFDSTMAFTFELFHDNLSYPSARNKPQSTWAR